jgi:large subunit ribosomal protein L29
MKNSEIRDLSINELNAKSKELKQEAFSLRLQQRSGQLENPSRLTMIRKDLARIQTELTVKNTPVTA